MWSETFLHISIKFVPKRKEYVEETYMMLHASYSLFTIIKFGRVEEGGKVMAHVCQTDKDLLAGRCGTQTACKQIDIYLFAGWLEKSELD